MTVHLFPFVSSVWDFEHEIHKSKDSKVVRVVTELNGSGASIFAVGSAINQQSNPETRASPQGTCALQSKIQYYKQSTDP